MNSITIDQLHEHTKKLGPKDLVLDVRTPEEFAEGHVPGSKNIPFDQVESRFNELKGTDHLYVYCRAGRRADVAASTLQQLGLDQVGIRTLHVVDDGGFPDWEDANYPVQK